MYKLLLVDDEKNIRNGIKNNCNWEQFQIAEVDTASNGAEALKKIQDCPPDFLITDIKMPVMDGLTLTEKVMESYPDVLCAVISGYDEFDLVRTAMQHNVRDYLLKPCSIEAIHELLKKLLLQFFFLKGHFDPKLYLLHDPRTNATSQSKLVKSC